jgi:hypothetical protein
MPAWMSQPPAAAPMAAGVAALLGVSGAAAPLAPPAPTAAAAAAAAAAGSAERPAMAGDVTAFDFGFRGELSFATAGAMPPDDDLDHAAAALAGPDAEALPPPSGLRIVSYNILAPDFAAPSRYSYCLPYLAPERRVAALVQELLRARPDVICLQVRCCACAAGAVSPRWWRQEVQPDVFDWVRAHLAEEYTGSLQMRDKQRDGCATFFRCVRYGFLYPCLCAWLNDRDDEQASAFAVSRMRYGAVWATQPAAAERLPDRPARARPGAGDRKRHSVCGDEHPSGRVAAAAGSARHVCACRHRCHGQGVHFHRPSAAVLIWAWQLSTQFHCRHQFLCGDFNDEPQSPPYVECTSVGLRSLVHDATGADPVTFATQEHNKAVDFIFGKGDTLRAMNAYRRVDPLPPLPDATHASDHVMLWVDVQL